MKAHLTNTGTLVLTAESGMETFAMRHWMDELGLELCRLNGPAPNPDPKSFKPMVQLIDFVEPAREI